MTLGIAGSPEDLKSAWTALEARAGISPYQRYDLCAAWARHAAPGAGVEVRIGVVRDETGRAVLILPFGIVRQFGIAAAVYLGGSHFNVNMPLADPDLSLDAETVGEILDAYAAATGADAFLLRNQPRTWRQAPHPFLSLPHDVAPDDVRLVVITGSYQDYLKSQFTRKMRSENKRKTLKFNEAGPTAARRASSPAEVDDLLAAFIEQKSKRLASQGIGDPFAEPGVMHFLRDAAYRGVAGDGGMEIHGMTINGRLISVRAGIRHGEHLSFMLQSFATDDPLAKYSPSEYLLYEVMAEAHAAGVNAFDFGVGDGRFKQAWSNELAPLFNTTRPVTKKGRLYASLMRLERGVIRTIKRNPSLFAAVQEARASVARLRGLA